MTFDPLTRIDIAALRKADSILFHHRHGEDAKIQAVKEAPDATERNPFPTEQRHTIHVASTVRTFDRADGDTYRGFHMIHSAQYNAPWRTIAAMLRAGDVVSLSWYRGNNTEAITQAGLVRDELRLCVKRGDKPQLMFIVYVSVGLDNTARLTQVVPS